MNAVEVVEASPDESAHIAAGEIRKALAELDKIEHTHESDHVRMYLMSALCWIS